MKKTRKPARKSILKLEDPSSSGETRFRAMQGMFKEWTKSALAMLGGVSDYNPDDLVLAKGDGVRIYQDMLRDPYVKAAINLKKFSVARLPVQILPASDSEEDQGIAKFVEWNFDHMETSMDTLLWGVMNCVDVGFSIGEMNWRVLEEGTHRGKIGVKSVKSKDPYVYTFRIDDYGNIVAIVQRIGGYIFPNSSPGAGNFNNFGQSEFDPSKFLVSSFQPLYGNPYGQSDLRAAYRAFFIKDWSWKFRAIFMEKWGMPPIVGTFPNGTTEDRRKKLEEVLESIQNETVITIPEDLKIEILKVAQEGRTTEYERAISDLNKEILIGIMGSFLWAEEGKRTGARAQGEVHFKVSKMFVEHLASVVEDVMNRQLIKRLVDLNYRTESYPRFHFETSRAEDLVMELDIDERLLKSGVKLDPAYFYRKYGRPTPSESVATLEPGTTEPTEFNVPDQAPETVPSEETFTAMRSEALPEDPQKIGKLRETYAWMYRMREASSGTRRFQEAEDVAFELAGLERQFRLKEGKWMDSGQAWNLFAKTSSREASK